MEQQKLKTGRGGKRAGAGRKKKGHKAASSLAGIDLKAALEGPVPDNIDLVAQKYGLGAIDALVKQLVHGQSEAAKVNAANAVLDRGYAKPSTDAPSTQMSFFGPGVDVKKAEELRDYARRFANLAIEVLRKISESGASESARVASSKSLIDRGVGTVPVAKLQGGIMPRIPGKKEEAAQAAIRTAAGRYATPTAPRMVTDTLQ